MHFKRYVSAEESTGRPKILTKSTLTNENLSKIDACYDVLPNIHDIDIPTVIGKTSKKNKHKFRTNLQECQDACKNDDDTSPGWGCVGFDYTRKLQECTLLYGIVHRRRKFRGRKLMPPPNDKLCVAKNHFGKLCIEKSKCMICKR